MQSRKREEEEDEEKEEKEERRRTNEDVKAPKIEKSKETIVSKNMVCIANIFLRFIMKFMFYLIF